MSIARIGLIKFLYNSFRIFPNKCHRYPPLTQKGHFQMLTLPEPKTIDHNEIRLKAVHTEIFMTLIQKLIGQKLKDIVRLNS